MSSTTTQIPDVKGSVPAGYRELAPGEVIESTDLTFNEPESDNGEPVFWVPRDPKPDFLWRTSVGLPYDPGCHITTIRKLPDIPYVQDEIPAGYRELKEGEIVQASDLVPAPKDFLTLDKRFWLARSTRPLFTGLETVGKAYCDGLHAQTIRKIDNFDRIMKELFDSDPEPCTCDSCTKRRAEADKLEPAFGETIGGTDTGPTVDPVDTLRLDVDQLKAELAELRAQIKPVEAPCPAIPAAPTTDELLDKLRIAVDMLENRLRFEQADPAPAPTLPAPAPKPVVLSEVIAVDPELYADGKISVEMSLTKSDTIALWTLLRRIRTGSRAGTFFAGPLLTEIDELDFIPEDSDARIRLDAGITFPAGFAGTSIELKDSDV